MTATALLTRGLDSWGMDAADDRVTPWTDKAACLGMAREDALTQAWMDWHQRYAAGHTVKASAPEWERRITELAQRRQEIREATLAKIRGEVSDAR